MSYWGLAWLDDGWNTFQWLRERANRAGDFDSPAEFAEGCAAALTHELSRHQFADPKDSGIGIHFTAYEEISGYRIPELFALSRWTDGTYAHLLPGYRVRVTRETYATLKALPATEGRSPEFGQPKYRLEVHQKLHDLDIYQLFNNGDPNLFTPFANATRDTVIELLRRKQLKDWTSLRTHLAIARRPIEIVSKLLGDLAPDTRHIGGKPHDLAVNRDGVYESTTGDAR
jgi:hypothetical protein